jgi:hypothetical protein
VQVGLQEEERRRNSAKQLWAKIPVAYREQVTF